MINHVIISGPTGGIGVFLVKEHINRGIYVTAICRPGSARIKNLPTNPLLNIVECDIKDIQNVESCIEEADVFYHLAWAGTYGNKRNDLLLQAENMKGSLLAVNFAKKKNCKKFVGVGSTNEYGQVYGKIKTSTPCNPDNGYGIFKYCAGMVTKMECKKEDIEYNWCRIGSAYGPYTGDYTLVTGTLKKMLLGERTKFTKCEQQWSFIYNEDVARALFLVGEKGKNGKIYNIAGRESDKLVNYVVEMKNIVNPSLELGIGELPYYENQVFNLDVDITDLIEDTGYLPETEFGTGIIKTIEWIKENRGC